MNVVLHSASAVIVLLVSNCFWGAMIAILGSLIDDIVRFAALLIQKRFISFYEYTSFCIKSNISAVFIDMISCILAACFMLFTSFIYNSGNFRLFSIPAVLLGFFLGKNVLCRVFKCINNWILFCLKWIFDIVSFPLIWMAIFISRYISRTIVKNKKTRRDKFLIKYTKQCFSRIADEAQYGLIDDYYKDLENERTV